MNGNQLPNIYKPHIAKENGKWYMFYTAYAMRDDCILAATFVEGCNKPKPKPRPYYTGVWLG